MILDFLPGGHPQSLMPQERMLGGAHHLLLIPRLYVAVMQSEGEVLPFRLRPSDARELSLKSNFMPPESILARRCLRRLPERTWRSRGKDDSRGPAPIPAEETSL